MVSCLLSSIHRTRTGPVQEIRSQGMSQIYVKTCPYDDAFVRFDRPTIRIRMFHFITTYDHDMLRLSIHYNVQLHFVSSTKMDFISNSYPHLNVELQKSFIPQHCLQIWHMCVATYEPQISHIRVTPNHFFSSLSLCFQNFVDEVYWLSKCVVFYARACLCVVSHDIP